jgi:SagB-type dehydrogenase family enzyme
MWFDMGYVKLPKPEIRGGMGVEEALGKRRSVRAYLDEPISLKELSQILWAAQGMVDSWRRTSPSAGATYPLEIYVVVGKVQDIEPGIYRYDPKSHSIEMRKGGDVREELARASLSQLWISDASVVLAIAACYRRTTTRYGRRGERYVHMEAGHVGQNVHLEAVSLGLGTCMVGAFDDRSVKDVLELPEEEEPLYIMPVGKPR